MSRSFRSVFASASVLLTVGLISAACGGDNSQSNSAAPTTAASATTAAAAATSAASATSAAAVGTTAASSGGADTAAFQTIIDKAKQEGSVTIYSSQGTDQLNDLAKRFQSKYGVKLDV